MLYVARRTNVLGVAIILALCSQSSSLRYSAVSEDEAETETRGTSQVGEESILHSF